MGLLDIFSEHHNKVESGEHEGSLTHELIAGAAAYQAAKAYEEHCAKEGKPVDHATAKKIMAGFAGAAIDKLFETKGLDYIDKLKAKHHAEEQVHKYIEENH